MSSLAAIILYLGKLPSFLKHTASIFFVFLLLMQTFPRLAVLTDYLLNSNYITANLCENSTKPEMKCHGKCYLKKQLKNQDNPSPTPESRKDPGTTVLFYYNAEAANLYRFTVPTRYFGVNNFFTCSFHSSFFHPPSA